MKKFFAIAVIVFLIAFFAGYIGTLEKLKNEQKEENTPEKTEVLTKITYDVVANNSNDKKEDGGKVLSAVKEEKSETDKQNSHKKLISSGETNFNPNQIERSSNIRLAASYINGLILQPGEEFSFNRIVGKRTKERGFLPADIFVGQSVAKGYGGGVCQTSSTVCIAVRKTEMKILEQNPHSQRVSYTTIENEAMINYGTSDFRFLNTYDKPVLIEISFAENGDRENIKCDIYILE